MTIKTFFNLKSNVRADSEVLILHIRWHWFQNQLFQYNDHFNDSLNLSTDMSSIRRHYW